MKLSLTKPSKRSGLSDCRSAFSLIEIMIAVSLLALLIVGLLAMFFQVQRAFRAGTTQADIMEGGRATMSLLVRDLQEMAASQIDLSPLYYITNFVVVPGEGVQWRYQVLPNGDHRANLLQELALLSRNGDEWTGISYRLSNSLSGVGTLYRIVEPTNQQTLFYQQSNALLHLSRVVSEPTYANPAYHRVVDGVVNLTFTAYDSEGLPFNTYFNTNTYNHRFDSTAGPGGVYAFMADALPAYVDIELAVIEPSPLTKFKARWELDLDASLVHPWKSTNYLAARIGQTHVFRQRVPIRPIASDPAIRY